MWAGHGIGRVFGIPPRRADFLRIGDQSAKKALGKTGCPPTFIFNEKREIVSLFSGLPAWNDAAAGVSRQRISGECSE
jgi:hypothetical protein